MRVRAPATAMAGKLRRLHIHFTATIAMGKILTHGVMTFIGKKIIDSSTSTVST